MARRVAARSAGKSSRLSKFVALLLAQAVVPVASAATVDWDPNPSTSGAQGGSGTWDKTNTNWWNGAGNQAFADGDSAIFGASGGSVMVAPGGVIATALTFGVDGYTLSGDVINGVTLPDSTQTLSIGVVNAGTTATIDASLNAMTSVVKTGAGTLVLNGNNAASGVLAIEDGTVRAAQEQGVWNFGLIKLGSATTRGTISFANVTTSTASGLTLGDLGGTVHIEAGGVWNAYASDATRTVAGGTLPATPTTPATVTTLTKTGDGTLQFNHSFDNTFGGNVLIQGGVIEITRDQHLGLGTNGVILDTAAGSALATLRIMNTIDAGGGGTAANSKYRVFYVGDGGGAIDVQYGASFTVNDGPVYATPYQLQSVNPVTGADALNPAVASADVLRKRGAGRLILGNATDGYATSFTGTSVIEEGLVRLDHQEGLGLRQITVDGSSAVLASNAVPAVPNAIVLRNGGSLGSANGDRTFAGPISLETPSGTTFNSQDKDTTNPIDRTTILSGPVNDHGYPVTVSGNYAPAGNAGKGLVLANLSATPSSMTGPWTVQAYGALMVGGSGTVAVGDNKVAALPANLSIQDDATFGFRSDSGTTFGNYPTLPGMTFGLTAGPLNDPLARGVTVKTGQLALTGQTVKVFGENDYRISPSVLSFTSGTTFDTQGGKLIPTVLTNGGSSGTVTVKGNGLGSLIIDSAAGPHSINGTTFDLQPGGLLAVQGGGNPLGTAAFQFSGGTLGLTSVAGGATFSMPIAVTAASTADGSIRHFGNVDNSYAGTLNVAGGKTVNIDAASGTLNVTAPFAGTGTVNKTGPATVELSANNSGFTGVIAVSDGTLKLSNAAGNSARNTLQVNGGVADLAGTSQTIGALNLTGGAVANGTVVSPSINKAGGGRAEISARLNLSNAAITSTAGVLRLSNTATGAGANSLTNTTVTTSNGGAIEVAYAAGGSDPLAGNTVTLNGGGLRLAGSNGQAPGLMGTFRTSQYDGSFLTHDLDLMSSYWANVGVSTRAMSTVGGQAVMDFMTGAVAPLGLSTPMAGTGIYQTLGFNGRDNITSFFTGKLQVTDGKPLLLATNSDDGSIIFVDGKAVASSGYPGGIGTERGGFVELTPGLHDVTIAYYNGTGNLGVQSLIQPFGSAKTMLPQSMLSVEGVVTGSDVAFSGASTIEVVDAPAAVVGDLIGNGSLRVGRGVVTAGTLALNGDVTIDTAGGTALYVSGIGSGAAGADLTKSGAGTMRISGPSTYAGATTVEQGTLRVSDRASLNTAAAITVNNAAVLDIGGTDTDLSNAVINAGGRVIISAAQNTAAATTKAPTAPIAGTLEIRGQTIGAGYNLQLATGGMLQFAPMSADRTFSGNVELLGPAYLSTTGNSVYFNGVLSGNTSLTVLGGNGGTGGTNIEAPATLSGPVIMDGGIIRLRNTNGTMLNVSQFDILAGELNVSDYGAGTVPINRVDDNATINLLNGTVSSYMRDGGGEATETIGTLNLQGNGRIALSVNGTGNSRPFLDFTTLNRSVGSRIVFEATNLGGGTQTNRAKVTFGNAASFPLVNGILGGWAVANNTDFATYGANGVAPLTGAATTAQDTWTSGTSNFKYAMAGDIALGGPRQANSLVLTRTGGTLVNFNGNPVTLTTGGLLLVTNETVNFGSGITGTALNNDPGTLTPAAGQQELFVTLRTSSDNKYLDLTTKLTDNGAPVAVVTHGSGNGGNIIRLRNSLNDFTGGLYLNGGTVESRNYNDLGNAMGTGPVYLQGGNLNLRDAGTGKLAYGNDVFVRTNATISVDRGSGSSSGTTFVMGDLTMNAGRTLTVNNGNSYRIDFENVTLLGDGTINNNANADVYNAMTVPTGKVFTKGGSGWFTISTDNSATYQGTTRITGGNLTVKHLNALGASAPVVDVQGGNLVVNVQDFDLSNVTVAPTGGLRLRQPQNDPAKRPATRELMFLSFSATDGGTGSTGTGYDLTMLPGSTVEVSTDVNATHTLYGNLALKGTTTFNQTSGTTNTVQMYGVISGPGAVVKNATSGTYNLELWTANTYAGGTQMAASGTDARTNTLKAKVAGALSSGPVDVTSGVLELSAPGAADNNVSILNGQVLYDANEAAGGNVIRAAGTRLNPTLAAQAAPVLAAQTGQIMLTTNVQSVGSDRFVVEAGNIIRGESAQLALLNRNASGNNARNVTLAPGAIVAHVTPSTSAPTIQDLGTAGDLLFGLGVNFDGQSLTIGAGTPWRGLATDWNAADTQRFWRTGTITIADGTTSIDLVNNRTAGTGSHALIIGNGGSAGTRIIKAGGAAVPAHVYGGVTLDERFANLTGISQFIVHDGARLQLAEPNALGGGGGGTAVPVVIQRNGQLDPGGDADGATINGQVTIESGGIIQFNDTKNVAASTGSLVPHAGSIVLIQNNGTDVHPLSNVAGDGPAPMLTAAYNAPTTPAGIVVRLDRDNVKWLNETFADTAIFQWWNGNRTLYPNATGVANGLDVSGGGVTNDGSNRDIGVATNQPTDAANSIRVGPGGATFMATSGTFFTPFVSVFGAGNDVTFGSDQVVANFEKKGLVRLWGREHQWDDMTVAHGFAELGRNDGGGGYQSQFTVTGHTTVKSGAFLRMNAHRTGTGTLNARMTAAGTGELGTGITLEKGASLDLRLNTSSGGITYNTPITFSGAGTGVTQFQYDEEAGGGISILSNVTFADGADVRVFNRDMGRNEGRINAKVAGAATVRMASEFSFTGLGNASATEPATLRIGSPGDSAMRNVEVLTSLGAATGQGPLTVDLVRGGMIIANGVTIHPNVTINNLGSSRPGPLTDSVLGTYNTPEAQALVEGYIEVRAGQGSATTGVTTVSFPAGSAVNLGGGLMAGSAATNPQELRIYVDEAPTGQNINDFQGAINVVAGGHGYVAAERIADRTVTGMVRVAQVNLAAGSQVSLNANANLEMEVTALNATGDATVTAGGGSSVIRVGTINAGTNALTVHAGQNTRLTGNATAGQLNLNAQNFSIDPGAGVTSTIATTAGFRTTGLVTVATGTADFGTTMIAGARASGVLGAGLVEQRVGGTVNRNASTALSTTIQPGTVAANIPIVNTDAGPLSGWTNNNTYIYSGQILIPDNNGNGTGTIAFAEHFDDNVVLKVDGAERTWNDGGAGTPSNSGEITLSAGWHDIEFRFAQGGGGVGATANQGWPAGFALGYRLAPAGTVFDNVAANYQPLVHTPGVLELRATTPAAGRVDVAAGAVLNAGGVRDLVALNVQGTANFAASGSAANVSSTQALSIGAAGRLELNNNDLVVGGGANPDATLATVVDYVKQGRGAGSAWDGTTGITSAAAKADAADGQDLTGLAVIRNTDDGTTPIYTGAAGTGAWEGQLLDAGSVLVKYTYQGDATVNGSVNADDYLLADRGFLSTVDDVVGNEKSGYRNGDFNYDGKIDAADYYLIDRSFAMQGAALASAAGPTPFVGGARAAAVPEPATLGLLAVGAAGLLGRRRRRSR